MKNFLNLTVLILAFSTVAFAQETKKHKDSHQAETIKEKQKSDKRKPAAIDKQASFDASGQMTRGAALNKNVKLVALADVLQKPADYAGKTVAVEGVIVRSCKMEGCWMELAPAKDAKSVRVTFKDHEFFIPLDSAGLNARAEGIFSVKTLSKEQVEHLKNEDGAKFDNVNADGTVTEISFEANGVVLTKLNTK